MEEASAGTGMVKRYCLDGTAGAVSRVESVYSYSVRHERHILWTIPTSSSTLYLVVSRVPFSCHTYNLYSTLRYHVRRNA